MVWTGILADVLAEQLATRAEEGAKVLQFSALEGDMIVGDRGAGRARSAQGQGRPGGPGDRRVRSYPNSGCARIRAATPASGQQRSWRPLFDERELG
jgi:hypothetical protein